MTGSFATARRGFDATDSAYAISKSSDGVPDGAIARMMGRSVEDVRAVTRPIPLSACDRPPVEPPKPVAKLSRPRRRYVMTRGVAPVCSEPSRGGKPPREGTMASCVWWAAARHGVTVAQIMGPRRDRYIAHARHEAMWGAYELRLADGSRKFGRPRIGLYFHRDRQTVWAAIRAHEKRQAAVMGIAAE